MDFDSQTILLAEDNEDDVFIFTRAFKLAHAKNPLQTVHDGQETVDYLSGAGKYADRAQFPLPCLLLLDLKLPFRHGLEVLEWIRTQPKLSSLRVVVLTSSAEPRDLATARELGARFYLVKPPRAKTIEEMMAAVRADWNGGAAGSAPKLDGDLLREIPETGGAPKAGKL